MRVINAYHVFQNRLERNISAESAERRQRLEKVHLYKEYKCTIIKGIRGQKQDPVIGKFKDPEAGLRKCLVYGRERFMSDQDFILVDEEDTEKNIENSIENNTENNSGKDGGKDASAEEKDRDEIVASDKKEEDKDNGYEKICFICHRPESVTGRMIDLPNNITVCPDCMQKSFDAMTSGAVDLNRLMNTPGIQFLNMSDLENLQPRQQKIKKRKKSRKSFISLILRRSRRLIRSRQVWMNTWWGRNMPRRRCPWQCTTIISGWQQARRMI